MLLKEKMIAAAAAAKGGSVANVIMAQVKNETICADIQAAWTEVRCDEEKALKNALTAMKVHEGEAVAKEELRKQQLENWPLWAAMTAYKMAAYIVIRQEARARFWADLKLFLSRPQCFGRIYVNMWCLTKQLYKQLMQESRIETRAAVIADIQAGHRWEAWANGTATVLGNQAIKKTVKSAIKIAARKIVDGLKVVNKYAPDTTKTASETLFSALLNRCNKHSVAVNRVVAMSGNDNDTWGLQANVNASWTMYAIDEETLLLTCHGGKKGGICAIDGIARPDALATRIKLEWMLYLTNETAAWSDFRPDLVKTIKVACCHSGYNDNFTIQRLNHKVNVEFVSDNKLMNFVLQKPGSNVIDIYDLDKKTAVTLAILQTAGIRFNFKEGIFIEEQQSANSVVYDFFQNANEEKPLQNVTEEVARALFSDVDIEAVVDRLSQQDDTVTDKVAQQDKTARTLAAVYEAVKRGGSAKRLEEQLDKTLDKLAWHYRKAISIADNIKFVSKITSVNKVLSSKEVNSSYCTVFNNLVQYLREIRAIKKAAWTLCRYRKLEQYSRIEKAALDIFEKIKATDINSGDPWYALYVKYRTYQILGDDKADIIKEEAMNILKEQRGAGIAAYVKFVNGFVGKNADAQISELLKKDIGILKKHQGFADLENREEVISAIKRATKEPAAQKGLAMLRNLKSGIKFNRPAQYFLKTQQECIEAFRKQFMDRKDRHVTFSVLSFEKQSRKISNSVKEINYKVFIDLLDDHSSVFSLFVQKAGRFCKESNDSERYKENYSDDCLILSVNSWEDICQIFDIKQIKGNKVKAELMTLFKVISKDGNDTFWRVVKTEDDSFMLNIVNGNLCTAKEWREYASQNGFYTYTPAYCSSSTGELKNFKIRMCGTYTGPDTTRGVNWDQVYNAMTCGAVEAFSLFGDYDFKANAEFMQRMVLPNAFAHHFKKAFRSYVVFSGKFKDRNGFEGMDGTGFISALFAAASFTEETGGKTVFEAALLVGLLLQERAYNVNKRTGLIVDQETIDAKIRALIAQTGTPIVFYVNEMTEEQQNAWMKLGVRKFKADIDEGTVLVDSRGVEHKTITNKVIYFYATREDDGAPVEYLTDANGQKTAHMPWKYKSGLKVLSIAHGDNHRAVTSTQMLCSTAKRDLSKTMLMCEILGSVMIQGEEAKIFGREDRTVSVDDFVIRYTTEIDEDTGEERIVQKDPNLVDITHKLNPKFALNYFKHDYLRVVKQSLKKLNKNFGKLNLPIDGTHCMILPDIASMVAGFCVLGADGLVTDMYSSDPTARTISREEYIARVVAKGQEEPGISQDLIDATVRTIKSLSKGIVVIPANYFVMRLNEGCDFDGDSLYLLYMDKKATEFVDEYGVKQYAWDPEGEHSVTLKVSMRYPKNIDNGVNHMGTDAMADPSFQVEVVE